MDSIATFRIKETDVDLPPIQIKCKADEKMEDIFKKICKTRKY